MESGNKRVSTQKRFSMKIPFLCLQLSNMHEALMSVTLIRNLGCNQPIFSPDPPWIWRQQDCQGDLLQAPDSSRNPVPSWKKQNKGRIQSQMRKEKLKRKGHFGEIS